MKEFNLEEAKSGKPVCTRDGEKVRIICFDAKGTRPIVGLITRTNGDNSYEQPLSFTIDGKYSYSNNNNYDLVMMEETKHGWINIYDYKEKDKFYTIFKTKEEALYSANNHGKHYVSTVHVTWEE